MGTDPSHFSHRRPLQRSCAYIESLSYTFFFISLHMTDPLRHLVCEIRENYLPTCRTNCFNASHHCIPAIKFTGFQNMRTSCLMSTVSLLNMYTNREMASFQISDAPLHKNIPYTNYFKICMLSLIHPNFTIIFFIQTLYLCNGGCILTLVRAIINFRHVTNRHEITPNRRKTFTSINHRRKSSSKHYTLIDM